jgi:hypothetical protein
MTAPARDGARPREQTAPASRSSDGAILVTLFPDVRARTCRERTLTLPDLAQLIRTTVASEKARLPLLKLARLGTARSPAGSLRHDGNVIAVTGIEADYDGGAVGPDEAIEVAAKAGLRALIYTTPSHTPQRPRWRLLCPTSGELPPAERRHLVGRVNGLYRGIFAAESWTLSQAYYFGTVTGGPPPLVAVIDGMPIDRLDELDEAWLGPPAAPARPHGAAVAPMPRGPMSEDAVQRVIDRALARVRAAPDGAKHHTLRNAALLVGGVLDRARLGDGDAVRLLLGALPATVRDWRNAERTARWGVAAGRLRPIEIAQPPPHEPDPRRKETAALALRLLRAGASADAVAIALHQHNRRRADPMPATAVDEVALWARGALSNDNRNRAA